MSDDVDPGAAPDPERIPGSRGPLPTILVREEQDKFLRLVQQGIGVHTACERVGVAYRRVKRTLDRDGEFRDNFEHALALRRERPLHLLQVLAQGNKEEGVPPNADHLKFLINRDDKAAHLRQARKDLDRRDAAERDLRREIEQMRLDRLVGTPAAAPEPEDDLKGMSLDQLRDLKARITADVAAARAGVGAGAGRAHDPPG